MNSICLLTHEQTRFTGLLRRLEPFDGGQRTHAESFDSRQRPQKPPRITRCTSNPFTVVHRTSKNTRVFRTPNSTKCIIPAFYQLFRMYRCNLLPHLLMELIA